jgi:hypothetical protein
MKNVSALLLRFFAVVCLVAAWPRPAAAYLDILPPTLGNLCDQSRRIYVLRVEKFSAEKGVILFKSVEQLKGKEELSLRDGPRTKLVIGPTVPGAKVILDWVAEGKTAALFVKDFGDRAKAAGYICIDGYWYLVTWNREGDYWFAARGVPYLLTRYCGSAEKLGAAVAKILRGEEVPVPAMARDDRVALEEARGKIQDVQASLKILGDPKRNLDEPNCAGTVRVVSSDGKGFTVQPAPTKNNKQRVPIDIRVNEKTRITEGKKAAKLTVGQTVRVWLAEGSDDVAAEIHIGKPPENPKKKPEGKAKKPAPGAPEKKPEAGDKTRRESN